ncbi:Serine/threonine-protein kinase drkD [Balamuthia mandrillaris]
MFSKRGASNESAPPASPSPFVSARMLELRSEIERLNEALHDQLDLLQAHCQKLIDQKFGSEALLDQLEELEKKEAELQSQLVTAIKDLLVATQETRKSVLQDAQNQLTSSYDSSSSDSSFSSSSSSNSSSMVSNSLLSRTSDLLSNSVGVNLSQISTQIYRGGSTRTALKSKRGDNPFMRSGSGGASGGGEEENGGSLLHDISTWELQRGEINVLPELLGKGSFGCVNKGLLRGKHVAVKTITPNWASDKEVMEVLDDFRNECAVMSKALHPNVLLLMGVCIEQDQEQSKLLMVTELMPNGSVHSLIHNPKNKIPFKRRIRFAKDTALGMNYLHLSTPQIMHLDLKTQNLLVDAHYVAKVADFGLSRVKKAGSNKGATGSPLYMAPEVLADKPYDEKADVYSFGIVLWELVTQQKPFKEEAFETLEDIFQHVVIDGDRPEIPAACPPKLAELIKKCWHADPQVRPSFQAILESKILDDGLLEYP